MKITMRTSIEGMIVAEYVAKYGTVNYEGDVYVPLQQAYISGYGDNIKYITSAIKLAEEIVDDIVTAYELSWIPVDGWENNEDESSNCDWENPDGCREVSWAYVE